MIEDDRGGTGDSNVVWKDYFDDSSTMEAVTNITCEEGIPRAIYILKNQGVVGTVIVVLAWVCLLVVLGLFVELVIFVRRHYLGSRRRNNTLCILGLTPMFATCAIIGLMIPRAGTLVDLLANSYFAAALYSLVCLIEEYLGLKNMKEKCKDVIFSLNTPPFFCCCVCLPKLPYSKRVYNRLLIMVFQVTVVRPTLMFMAAVLWVDGEYTPGKVSKRSAFAYITLLNAISSITAVWGLVIMQKAFRPLLRQFKVVHKFLYIQLTIVGTVMGNLIIAALVSEAVIPCGAFLPSAARAHRIYHCFVVGWVLLVSVWGRFAFRHTEEGLGLPNDVDDEEEGTCLQTQISSENNATRDLVATGGYTAPADDVSMYEGMDLDHVPPIEYKPYQKKTGLSIDHIAAC